MKDLVKCELEVNASSWKGKSEAQVIKSIVNFAINQREKSCNKKKSYSLRKRVVYAVNCGLAKRKRLLTAFMEKRRTEPNAPVPLELKGSGILKLRLKEQREGLAITAFMEKRRKEPNAPVPLELKGSCILKRRLEGRAITVFMQKLRKNPNMPVPLELKKSFLLKTRLKKQEAATADLLVDQPPEIATHPIFMKRKAKLDKLMAELMASSEIPVMSTVSALERAHKSSSGSAFPPPCY
jgi:hypothetical protein